MADRPLLSESSPETRYLFSLTAVLVCSVAWLSIVAYNGTALEIGKVDWLDVLGESALAFYSLVLLALIAVPPLPDSLRTLIFVGLSMLFIGAITDVADEFVSVQLTFITAVENLGKSMGVLVACFGLYRLIFQIHSSEKSARELRVVADFDDLTGLGNRRSFNQAVRAAIESAGQGQPAAALALLDVDNFKVLNDAFGHLEGDKVLRVLSRMLSSMLREKDTAFRYGGEEFGILFHNCNLEEARLAAERIRVAFAEMRIYSDDGVEFCCTLSAGVAIVRPGDSFGTLLKRADEALYQAKHDGRNRVEVASPRLAVLSAAI